MNHARLAAALLLLPLLASPLLAGPPEKEPTPGEEIDAAVASHRTSLAKKHRTLARWCRSRKLARTALAHLRFAHRLAPDLGSVRLDLGYKKSGGRWVLRKPPDLDGLKDTGDLTIAYFDRDAKLRRDRIDGLLRIAKRASELGLDDRARELNVRAFRIDPNRTEPRAALGHVVIGGRGYSPAEAKLVPPTVSVTKDRTPSELARALGLQLLAYRAGRFMFESRGAEHQFRLVLESAVRADGLVSFLLKGDAGSVVPMPLNTHALGGAESFELYLRRANLPAAQAAVARSTGLHSTYAAQVTSAGLAGNAPYMADWLVHGVVIQSCVGPNPQGQAWLKVGLSDYVSERVVGTMQTRLFVVEESSGVNLMAERPGAEVWRIRVRNRALLEDDPKAGILFSSAFTGMSLEDAMKSWSLVAYLVERDVAKFREFARAALASDSIRALKSVYDLEPEGLDAAWRSWVIDHG